MCRCRIYFSVLGDENIYFDTQDFLKQLGIKDHFTVHQKGEIRDEKRKVPYLRSEVCLGMNEEFDININAMIRSSLGFLFPKWETLVALKEKYHLLYYLERVVYLSSTEVNPILSLDEDIIDFLSKAKIEDDLDYYVAD